MAFKERVKRFGRSVKKFWKDHWQEVALVTGGVAVTGAVAYGLHELYTGSSKDETEKDTNEDTYDLVAEKTAWNKDWDEMATQFELLTHQPLGSFENGYTEEEGYVDPLDGNCFIVAGYNSYYNESPDQLDFYVLDNEGWYHRMPDELRT